MKTLIYAMQGSGASFFAYYLSQNRNTIGILDLNNFRLAPYIDTNYDLVLKCVVTNRYSFEKHCESFKPDKTILFLRNPNVNYIGLKNKPYANENGTVEEKLSILNGYFNKTDLFDEIIYYEKFLNENIDFNFTRTRKEIVRFNNRYSKWCRDNPEAPYDKGGAGIGNIHKETIDNSLANVACSDEIKKIVKELCPDIFRYYNDNL